MHNTNDEVKLDTSTIQGLFFSQIKAMTQRTNSINSWLGDKRGCFL